MVVPEDRDVPRWLKLFGAFAVLCLAAFAFALLLPAGRFTELLLAVLDDPAIAFAVAALLVARSRSRGGMRRVWGLFAAGTAAWLVGEALFEVREALGAGNETSIADVFYLLFYPPVMAGLYLIGREDRRTRQPGWPLDVVIVMGGMALLLWTLVRQTSLDAAGGVTTQVVDIAYVALGLGLLWLLVLPVLHTELRWTRSRTLVGWAFAGTVVADTIWVLTPTEAYGLIASSSLALLGFAAARDPALRPAEPDLATARRRHLIGELAVVGVGAFAGGVVTWLTIRDGASPDLVLGAAALLALVLARLAVSISATDRLLRASDRRASTDPLTGLLNHGSFREHLAREAARAERSDTPLALLYVDLDHLKAVNDLGGHREGDRVLIDLAELVSATCRRTDLVCRVGGDELAVIAPATTMAQAAELAERLVTAAHDVRVAAFGDHGRMSLSLGASVFPDPADDIATLLAQADAALYAAKQAGRDRWRTFDELADDEIAPELQLDRTRAKLAARDADFRAVFTYALEPMIITDHAPRILHANDAAARLAGVPGDALIGRDLREFVAPADSSELARIRASVARSSRKGGTIAAVLPSGREALIEFTAARFAPGRTLVALRDITERTAAMNALARSESRFRGLFDGAPDAMLVTDDAGVILDGNPAAARLTGRPRAELRGMLLRDLGRDADRERIDQVTAELRRDHALADTYAFVNHDGETRLVEYASVPDFVPGEHLSIVRDVTERVAAMRRS